LTALLLVLLLLLRRSRHDAIVVLRMLEVVLRRYAISLSVRIAGQLKIFLIYMRSGAADFHLRPARIEGPVWVVMLAAAMIVLRPTAALP
jgi:hypothetical protein